MYEDDDDLLMGPDLDDSFQVEPGDMLYKPLRKGNAIMLNAGTVLTAEMIRKISESGLIEDARRSVKKAIKDPGIGATIGRQYDAEIEKSQRIRDSLSALRMILWFLLICTGAYTALNKFEDLFYVYLAAGMFVAIVVTYLVSMSVYDNQTKLMREKSSRIKEARRRLEERAERARQEKIQEMRGRLEGNGFL